MTSHRYYGWGGEDDEMAYRINNAGFKKIRYPASIARYMFVCLILIIKMQDLKKSGIRLQLPGKNKYVNFLVEFYLFKILYILTLSNFNF